MSKVYCVSDHSPEELVRWLSNVKDVPPTSITIQPAGERLKSDRPKKYKKFILLLSYTDFTRSLRIINSNEFRHKEFYVLLPVSRFVEFENIQPLDFKFSDDSNLSWDSMELQEEFLEYNPTGAVSKCRENFRDLVINKVKSVSSILAPLMTIVYTVGKTVQKPFTFELCSYLYYDKDNDSDLESLMSKLRTDFDITGKSRPNRVRSLLVSSLSDQVKVACSLIREAKEKNQTPDFAHISNVSGVHSYDLNYISNVVENADDYAVGKGITVRDFQKNQLAKKKRTKLKGKK